MSQIKQINVVTDATTLVGGTSEDSPFYQWKVAVPETLPDGRQVTHYYEGQFSDWMFQDDNGKWSVVDNTAATNWFEKQTTYDSDISSTGLSTIQSLSDKATNDQNNVLPTQTTNIAQYTTDFSNQSAAFTPWVPQATYTPSDLSTLHDQIVWILNEMGSVMSALSSLSRWRSDADSIVINISNTLTWISKKITGQ